MANTLIQLSKEVTDKMRDCLFVLSTFLMEGMEVAETSLGITQPNLQEGDEPPGFASVIVGLHRTLKAAMDEMVTADHKLYAALAWESSLRKARLEKIDDLALKLIALRRTVIGQYVKPDLDGLGLQPVDARDSITVMRRVELLGERFQEATLDQMLGEPRFTEPPDVRKNVGQMTGVAEEVRGLVEQINEAERRTDKLRLVKQEAMKSYDGLFMRSVRIFEDLCRFAGNPKLADKVRASTKRPGRTAQEPPAPSGDGEGGETPPDSEPTADAEPAADETAQD